MGKLARLIVQPQDVLYDLLGIFQPRVGTWYPGAVVHDWRIGHIDFGANILCASYYPIFRRFKADRIGIRIEGAGATGARARLGIYKDDGNFYPGSLVADFGEIDASTAGNKLITIDRTFDVGIYWIAFILNDPTIDVCYNDHYLPLCRDVLHSTLGRYSVYQTYGPLPDPFPSGVAQYPRIYVERLRVKEVY